MKMRCKHKEVGNISKRLVWNPTDNEEDIACMWVKGECTVCRKGVTIHYIIHRKRDFYLYDKKNAAEFIEKVYNAYT